MGAGLRHAPVLSVWKMVPRWLPVQFRVMGEDLDQLRTIANEVATIGMRKHDDSLQDVHFDWNDKVKSLKVEIDWGRARALGVSETQEVAQALQAWLSGVTITVPRSESAD